MGLATFDEGAPFYQRTSFVTADGTTLKDIANPPNNRVRVDAIVCINQDTIAHVVNLNMTDGGGNSFLGSLSIPAGQGTNGTPGVDLLAGCLPATVVGVVLPPNARLQASLNVAISGAVQLMVACLGGTV